MRELCERLRKFQEEFERGQGRKMTPEELSYLDAAQELIDGESQEPSKESMSGCLFYFSRCQ